MKSARPAVMRWTRALLSPHDFLVASLWLPNHSEQAMKKFLVIDDEHGTRVSIQAVFGKLYNVTAVSSVAEARAYLKSNRPSIVLLDIVLPEEGGLEFLEELKEVCPGVPVLMISAYSSPATTKKAMSLGAVGVIHKPYDVNELRKLVAQSISAAEKPRVDTILESELARKFDLLHCAARSSAYRELLRQGMAAAESGKHVFLRGEMGTGKELLARQIHFWRHRSADTFIKAPTGHANGQQLAKRLFGSTENGEPVQSAIFDLAEGGTIFIDRVELLPDGVRKELAGIVRHKRFRRVGAERNIPTETRLVLSSPAREAFEELNGDGGEMEFLDVPPLRERREDIPALAEHLLSELRESTGAVALQFGTETMERLKQYAWPGNLRELRNVIERAMVLYPSERELDTRCLPSDMLAATGEENDRGLESAVAQFEAEVILKMLRETNGNVTEAARRLKTTPRKLQYRIDRLGLLNGKMEAE